MTFLLYPEREKILMKTKLFSFSAFGNSSVRGGRKRLKLPTQFSRSPVDIPARSSPSIWHTGSHPVKSRSTTLMFCLRQRLETVNKTETVFIRPSSLLFGLPPYVRSFCMTWPKRRTLIFVSSPCRPLGPTVLSAEMNSWGEEQSLEHTPQASHRACYW